MSIAAFSIAVALAVVIVIAVPLIIGTYVYRDAGRRGMNALLWALVAAAAPALIGLIVYLLVRGSYCDLRCPRCDTPVKEQFVVCPRCGAKLRPACPACAMPVEPDWKVCPKCAQTLADVQMDVQPPVRENDRSIWKVLAIVLIVPALLIVVLALGLTAYTASGSSGFREVSIGEYFEEMHTEGAAAEAVIAEKVEAWMNGLDTEADHAYALRYDYAAETGNEHFFLIYIPSAGDQTHSGMGQSDSIFGTTLTLELQRTGNSGCLFNVTSSADRAPKLKVILDGRKIPCDVTTVDYNPTLFFIVSQ